MKSYPRQALTRVSSAKVVPVVPEATTPPKLTPKDVNCVADLIETMELENLTGQAAQGLYSGEASHESRGAHAHEQGD